MRVLGLTLGDKVEVCSAVDIPYGQSLYIAPITNTHPPEANLYEKFILPHFLDAYRPVSVGDIFSCESDGERVEFEVMETVPESSGMIVAPGWFLKTLSITPQLPLFPNLL